MINREISLIAAVSHNGIIGVDGKIPWNIPEDLNHFKKLTMNGVVIMGRNTFQSSFMAGDMKMKGDFKVLRGLDQVLIFGSRTME